jgi:hypothetical protein
MAYMRDWRGARLDSFDATRDLSNVVAWWDMSSLSALADGASISQVGDLSGNGHHLLPFSAATAPSKQRAANGLAIANFAASSTQRLNNNTIGGNTWPASVGLLAPLTVVIVFRPSATQTNTAPYLLKCAGQFELSFDNNLLTGILSLAGNGATVTTSTTTPSGPNLLDGNWHVAVATCETNSASLYVDGYLVGSAPAKNFIASAISFPTVGSAGGAQPYNGDVAEVVFANSRLPQNRVNAVTAALAAKWGATLSANSIAAQGSQTYTAGSTADGSTTRKFAPGKPAANAPLILWSHPAGATETIDPNYFAYPLVHAATAQGWYFAATSQAGVNSWGNPASMTALANLYADMVSNYGPFPKVVLAGGSMGGIASLNAIIQGTVANVVGAYLIDPTASLLAMYKGATYTSAIATAYGLTSGTLASAASAGATSISSSVSFAAGTSIAIDPNGTNPEQVTTTGAPSGAGPYTIPVPALGFAHSSGVAVSDYGTKTSGSDPLIAATTNFAGKYLRFYPSTGDSVVVKSQHTTPMVAHLASAGTAECSVGSHDNGPHLGFGSANPSDFVAFVKRACGL